MNRTLLRTAIGKATDGARHLPPRRLRGSLGSGPLVQHIGLGAADRLERLEVHWPASGLTQTFSDVAMDGAVEITEGEDTLRRLDLPAIDW